MGTEMETGMQEVNEGCLERLLGNGQAEGPWRCWPGPARASSLVPHLQSQPLPAAIFSWVAPPFPGCADWPLGWTGDLSWANQLNSPGIWRPGQALSSWVLSRDWSI